MALWVVPALNARGDNKRKVIMDLESQLDQAKQDRADYEAEVSEHFSQTADLLHKLTDDYRLSTHTRGWRRAVMW